MAYRILNRTGLFQRWIIDWNNRPQAQKMCTNLKLHFWQAHHQLSEMSNLQARDSLYHANATKEMTQEIILELHTNQ